MKLKSLLFFLLFIFVLNASAADPGKLKVLLVTGGRDFVREPFFKMFSDNPKLDVTSAAQGKSSEAYDRDDLGKFDVLILYDLVQEITPAQKAKFLSLFQKGTGLVMLHHAFCSYQNWPDYERIVGGKYLMEDEKRDGRLVPKSTYEHDVDIPVVVVTKEHPITAGVADFTLHDEIYSGFHVSPDVTALLTTTQPKSGRPLAWCRTEGKSRVFAIQLGHGPQAFSDENYRRLVWQAIDWVSRK